MAIRTLLLAALLVATVAAQLGVQVSETNDPNVINGVLGSLQNPPGGVTNIVGTGGTGGAGQDPSPWPQQVFWPQPAFWPQPVFRPWPCRRPRPFRPQQPFFWGFRGRSGAEEAGTSTAPTTLATAPNTQATTPAAPAAKS